MLVSLLDPLVQVCEKLERCSLFDWIIEAVKTEAVVDDETRPLVFNILWT